MSLDSDIAGALGDNGPPSGASELEVLRPHLISRHPEAPIDVDEDDHPAKEEGGRIFAILAVGLVLLGLGVCVAAGLGVVAVAIVLLMA